MKAAKKNQLTQQQVQHNQSSEARVILKKLSQQTAAGSSSLKATLKLTWN
ncbi:MAG: hypothetical protein U5K84_05845 [Alkalibacterium sp.]|nr:hypothetical protein [Alkalibacterium sp.]